MEEDAGEDIEEDSEDIIEDFIRIITITIITIVHIRGMIIYHPGRSITIGEDPIIILKYLLY